jgi:predicted RNase H-like HicB family nuclease
MNLDILIKPIGDGRFNVSCPNFPDCSTEGTSVEEAVELLIEKVSSLVANNVKQNMKNHLREMAKNAAMKGPIDAPFMISNLPLSLN